ncbi:hypothetical protein [Eleftheria terrae]|uniref:hypothetical protein n=1 Tax=Eleftheria terrae TaxID=1597781 RepID=UPI00263AF1BF|nr:hypothetical protein [Eleftheria terrae]WKB56004.1 hypothetical protein N7L95_28450 [Eleftheria terrae]
MNNMTPAPSRDVTRTPRTVTFNGRQVHVLALDVALSFTRKPVCLDHVAIHGDPQRVYITTTHHLTAAEFDEFTSHFMRRRSWLTGAGGSLHDAALCIEVVAPQRPALYVNPEGADYARYVARLG